MKNKSIKMLLFGNALLLFFPYAQSFMNDNNSVIASIISGAGSIFPIIGILICLIALFVKD